MILPDLAELSGLRGAVRGLSLRAHRPAMAPARLRLWLGERSIEGAKEGRRYAASPAGRRIK